MTLDNAYESFNCGYREIGNLETLLKVAQIAVHEDLDHPGGKIQVDWSGVFEILQRQMRQVKDHMDEVEIFLRNEFLNKER